MNNAIGEHMPGDVSTWTALLAGTIPDESGLVSQAQVRPGQQVMWGMLANDFDVGATISLPPEEVLTEHAYLAARGVRPLSLAGHCHLPDDPAVTLVRVATQLERCGEPNVVPFVVDHGDGVASYGYSAARWALDLYEWAVKNPAVPQEQRDRIIGLLLGYGTPAVSRYEEEGSGRRFRAAATGCDGSGASWLHACSASTAGMSPRR